MTEKHNEEQARRIRDLEIQVGFLLQEAAGTRSQMQIQVERAVLSDNLKITQLAADLDLKRAIGGIWITGSVEGTRSTECSRCLESYDMPVNIQFEEMFYYPASNSEGEDEFTIPENANLKLQEPLRQQIRLALPMSPVCDPDCAGLCNLCGVNFNREQCDCEDDLIDPRFAVLEELKKKLDQSG